MYFVRLIELNFFVKVTKMYTSIYMYIKCAFVGVANEECNLKILFVHETKPEIF
jgi:hypothetical protein